MSLYGSLWLPPVPVGPYGSLYGSLWVAVGLCGPAGLLGGGAGADGGGRRQAHGGDGEEAGAEPAHRRHDPGPEVTPQPPHGCPPGAPRPPGEGGGTPSCAAIKRGSMAAYGCLWHLYGVSIGLYGGLWVSMGL